MRIFFNGKRKGEMGRQNRGRAKKTRYSGQISYQGLPWQLQKSYQWLLFFFFLSASHI